MAILGVLPEGHALDIYILSTLTSLVAANSRFLLGKNQIFGFNLTFVLQGGLLFFVLLFLYYGLKIQNVTAYLWGMYFTNGIAFLVSLFLLLPFLNKKEADPRKGRSQYALLKEMFAYGLWGSADNIAEILTTRLNYFLIQRFAGLGSVGLLEPRFPKASGISIAASALSHTAALPGHINPASKNKSRSGSSN